jgi:hypothetical protein
LERRLDARHRTATVRGQVTIAAQISNAHQLIQEARFRLEQDEQCDPTTDIQALLSDTMEALSR